MSLLPLWAPHFWAFEITFRHTTLGRTLWTRWLAHRNDTQHATLTKDRNPWRNSNPQSQEAGDPRLTMRSQRDWS